MKVVYSMIFRECSSPGPLSGWTEIHSSPLATYNQLVNSWSKEYRQVWHLCIINVTLLNFLTTQSCIKETGSSSVLHENNLTKVSFRAKSDSYGGGVWRYRLRTSWCQHENCHCERKLKIPTAYTKAKLRESAYSKVLSQNKINRQRQSRESGRHTVRRLWRWCLGLNWWRRWVGRIGLVKKQGWVKDAERWHGEERFWWVRRVS